MGRVHQAEVALLLHEALAEVLSAPDPEAEAQARLGLASLDLAEGVELGVRFRFAADITARDLIVAVRDFDLALRRALAVVRKHERTPYWLNDVVASPESVYGLLDVTPVRTPSGLQLLATFHHSIAFRSRRTSALAVYMAIALAAVSAAQDTAQTAGEPFGREVYIHYPVAHEPRRLPDGKVPPLGISFLTSSLVSYSVYPPDPRLRDLG